jgi:ketosteroid isomerase-like protein
MRLTKKEIRKAVIKWNEAWDRYDLDGVMDLFHDEILFDNWTGGRAKGKENLRRAWTPWFNDNGGFKFHEEEIFIDEEAQKILYRWVLHWPSTEQGYEGKPEVRCGVDVMHFKDGKIINKLTYAKATVEIEGQRVKLTAH